MNYKSTLVQSKGKGTLKKAALKSKAGFAGWKLEADPLHPPLEFSRRRRRIKDLEPLEDMSYPDMDQFPDALGVAVIEPESGEVLSVSGDFERNLLTSSLSCTRPS